MRNEKQIDMIFLHFKEAKDKHYVEDTHCKLLIEIMLDPDKGTIPAFCVDAMISDDTFYAWANKYPLFREVYCYSKLIARQNWEAEG